jgi:hypothetical protein
MLKRRLTYLLLFLAIIPVGLATRKRPQWFTEVVATYGGDVLWSAMFFWLFRCLWPAKKLHTIALYAYAFGVAIEVSQLYHAPWIDRLRGTFAGKMILGSGFLWSDIVCYLVGVLIGWLVALAADKVK